MRLTTPPPLRVFLALMLLLGVFCAAVAAEERGDPGSRCEWTDCGAVASPSGGLSVCGESDRGVCGEQCRTEFDREHFRCIERCLKSRCREEARAPTPEQGESIGETDLCLEGESRGCEIECRESDYANKPRCRLACLSRLCSSSRRSALAEEAANPGAAKCRRCRSTNEWECRRSCGVGFSTKPGSSFSGIGSFGCEKACLIGVCGAECAF